MGDAPIRIIHISDLHLRSDSDKALLGVKPQKSLEAVAKLLQLEKENIHLIVITGDLSHDGSSTSYVRLADSLALFQVPVYYTPGNHDDIDVMSRVYPYKMVSNARHVILKDWHLILLNSKKPRSVEGVLDSSQFTYLQHCLQAYPNHRAVIVFHHQPLSVDCKWLDRLGIANADEFWKMISAYPAVAAILFGHVHQAFEHELNGVKCYAAPSTCIQFKPKHDVFALENIPPGYRWIDLYPDGHVETGVNRVASYVGTFDANAKGY